MSSFEKWLFIYFAHSLMGLLLFFPYKFLLVLCRFWILALCQMGRLQKFFPFCWLQVHSNDSFIFYFFFAVHPWDARLVQHMQIYKHNSSHKQKLWNLIRSLLSILAFVANTFGVLVMKSLPMPMS